MTLVGAIVILAVGAQAAAAHGTVDQANESQVTWGAGSCVSEGSGGRQVNWWAQSFVPTADSVAAVDMYVFGAPVPSEVTVCLVAGTAHDSPVLATTVARASVDESWLHFDFGGPVPATPGTAHTIDFFGTPEEGEYRVMAAGTAGAGYSEGSAYLRGIDPRFGGQELVEGSQRACLVDGG